MNNEYNRYDDDGTVYAAYFITAACRPTVWRFKRWLIYFSIVVVTIIIIVIQISSNKHIARTRVHTPTRYYYYYKCIIIVLTT